MLPTKKEEFISSYYNGTELYVDKNLCRQCKGRCCKVSGCGLLPCDIPIQTPEGIRAMLDTGKFMISVAFTTDGLITPIMSSREVGADRIDFNLIHRPCALLGPNGCPFSDDERPMLGLLFIPKENKKCYNPVNGTNVFLEWSTMAPIMEEVIFNETGKSSEELFLKSFDEAASYLADKYNRKEAMTDAELSTFIAIIQTFL